MPTTQRLFQFQIVTDTPKEAEQFMKEVEAFDTSVEEWWYSFTDGREDIEYCCGFGVTHYKPKLIKRIADFMDFSFVYAEPYQYPPDCHCDDYKESCCQMSSTELQIASPSLE